MSYFCANAITIDKRKKTFRVKGGSNNIVPRCNGWTEPFEVSHLLEAVSSGGVQFKTRNVRNIAIENICYNYADKVYELTGLTPYDCDRLPNTKAEEKRLKEAKPSDWWYNEAQRKLKVSESPKLLEGIKRLKKEFVEEIINLRINRKKKFIVRSPEKYVVKYNSTNLIVCRNPLRAKKFCKVKAQDVSKNYDDYFIEEVE